MKRKETLSILLSQWSRVRRCWGSRGITKAVRLEKREDEKDKVKKGKEGSENISQDSWRRGETGIRRIPAVQIGACREDLVVRTEEWRGGGSPVYI